MMMYKMCADFKFFLVQNTCNRSEYTHSTSMRGKYSFIENQTPGS